jgi:hypothetical protein
MQEIEAVSEVMQPDRILKTSLMVEGRPLSYAEFIDALHSDGRFRQWFSRHLADVPFESFRWETPVLTPSTLEKPLEFVLINAPLLSERTVDAQTFAPYFNTDESVVVFKSLGGDATLIVPTPHSEHEHYNHLATFLRHAPDDQIDALWQTVAKTLSNCCVSQPLWLNTEGSGVAWLHVRIDSRPKYYGYAPYKQVQ